jgi:hypothetical protein
MEPKEKAKELFDRYYQLVKYPTPSWRNITKQCALITVDEIIIEREVIYASIGIPPGTFWKEVKAEIEAL